MKFKIRISQLIAKILFKPRSLNQIRRSLTRQSNLTSFFIRKYESILMTRKIEISQFYD